LLPSSSPCRSLAASRVLSCTLPRSWLLASSLDVVVLLSLFIDVMKEAINMRRTIGTTSSTRPRTTVRPSTTSHTRQSTRPSVVSTPGKPLSSFVSSLNSRKTVSYTPRDREKLTLHTPTRIKRTAASPSSSTSHGKPVSTFIFSLNGQVDETTNDNDYRGKGNNVPSRSRTPDRSDHQLTASSTTKRTKSLTPSTSTSHGKPVSTFIFSLNGQVDETTNDNDYRGKRNNVPSRSRTPGRSDHQLTASSTTMRTKSHTPASSHGKPVSTFIFSLNGQVGETTNDNDYRGKGNNVPSRNRTPGRSDHQLTASSTTKRTKSLTPSTSTSHGKPVSTFIFSLNGQVDEPDLASETLGHDSRSYRHSTSTDRGASRTMPRKDFPKPLPRLRSLPYKPIDPRKDQLNEDGMHPSWLIRRRNAAAQRALCTRRVKRLHIRFVDDGHDEQSD